MGWSLLDHTGDLGLVVDARRLDDLFVEALRGMTNCLTEVRLVRQRVRRRLDLSAAAVDLLLVDWLQEALYLFDTESLVFARAEVDIAGPAAGEEGDFRLRARLAGERIDASRHPVKAPIKAVTYHALEVARHAGGWRARLVFDL